MEPTAKKRRLTDRQGAEKAVQTKVVKMDDIPNQLLLELFQYFDRTERRERLSVCKRWTLLLKSRSLCSQSHLAIEVPMNFAINSRPKPPPSLWSVCEPVKTLIFYGPTQNIVLSGIEAAAGGRLRRIKKEVKTSFKEITDCVKREARNYFIINNVHFIADVLFQMLLHRSNPEKVVLGQLDISLELLLTEGIAFLSGLPPLFVMNIRLPGLNKSSIDTLVGYKNSKYGGPHCTTMYYINGFEEVKEEPDEKNDHSEFSLAWVELKLAKKYMPVLTQEQIAEVEKRLQLMSMFPYYSSYEAVLCARMLLSQRYPKEFPGSGAKLSKNDVIQSLLQKPDMVFLLYWWFIFRRQRDEDPRPAPISRTLYLVPRDD